MGSKYKEYSESNKLTEVNKLRCPCCGKPMQFMKVTEYYAFDEDKHYIKYRCKDCNIKYNEDTNCWEIPKGYVATVTKEQVNYLNGLYNNALYSKLYKIIIYDTFGYYIPGVLSKEFASKLIQEKLDEWKVTNLQERKINEYNKLLLNYGINPHYTRGNCGSHLIDDEYVGYELNIEGGKIIFQIKKDTYELNTKEINIEINDLLTFSKHYNNEEISTKLFNLREDLLKLKQKQDKEI